jgi:hypothetical protein
MKSLIKVIALFFLVSGTGYPEGDAVLTGVSLDQATRQILSIANNTVLGATTEIIDGKKIHVIKVLGSDGWIKFYKIDAETGAVIS